MAAIVLWPKKKKKTVKAENQSIKTELSKNFTRSNLLKVCKHKKKIEQTYTNQVHFIHINVSPMYVHQHQSQRQLWLNQKTVCSTPNQMENVKTNWLSVPLGWSSDCSCASCWAKCLSMGRIRNAIVRTTAYANRIRCACICVHSWGSWELKHPYMRCGSMDWSQQKVRLINELTKA